MSEKKQIDKLFKERLKDFEVAPGDHVWDRIEDELHKDKRKRRVIPIWWKVVGVAAVLALLFTVGKTFFNSSEVNAIETEVVDSENSDNPTEDSSSNSTHSKFDTQNNSQLVDSPEVEEDTRNEINSSNVNNLPSSSENTSLANQSNEDTSTSSKTNNADYSSQKKTSVATSKSDHIKDKSELLPLEEKQKRAIAKSDSKQLTPEKESLKSVDEMNEIIKDATNPSQTKVADGSSVEKEQSKVLVDSTKTTTDKEEVNAIEEAIAQAENIEKENDDKDDTPSKRWSVAPNVAPVYFNSLGEGSPIDDQFITNAKEGEINVSYGIRGSYAINDKLRIRAGVNRVDLGYSTRNVIEFSRPSASIASNSRLKHVKLNDNTSAFISANSISLSTAPDILFIKEQGSIDQQLGFIEVPVELEYSLIEKKFGLNLIGGFSTLFLNNNEIYSAQNNGVRTLLGEATNINNMSYSANFGIGFNYSLSRQLRFNLEPMFKYQINTFNDTAGDFQPFFIGVYTGLSFKF